MELVALLRLLWQRRLVVVAGGAALVAAVLLLMLHHQPSETGVAVKRLMLDTKHSELVHAAPQGGDTLPWRAALLGELAASDELRKSIARQAGIPADQLAVARPNVEEPDIDTPLPRKAAAAAALTSQPYVIKVFFDTQTPILVLLAKAPDMAGARRLVEGAGTALERLVESPSAGGRSSGLVLEDLASTRASQRVSGVKPVLAAGGAVCAFGFWCACVALGAGIVSRSRRARLQPA